MNEDILTDYLIENPIPHIVGNDEYVAEAVGYRLEVVKRLYACSTGTAKTSGEQPPTCDQTDH